MTETQAKSGSAGATTDPTHGSARPGSDAPDPQGAATEAGAVADPGDGSEAAGPVIRRGRPAGPTAASPSEAGADEPSGTASTAAAEPATTYRAAAPDPSPTRTAGSTARPYAEPTVRTRPAAGDVTGSARKATGAGAVPPVGRAPVMPSSTPVKAGSRGAASAAGRAVTSAAAVGAARVTDTFRTARATVAGAASRGPRRARLHLKRIDPWSVMKFSFAVSLVLFVVAIVATSVLYLALDAMGVFDSVNNAAGEIIGQSAADTTPFKVTAKGVIGTAVLLGAVNMVLFTALATLAAFVYNVCADLVGGVELTLSEKE